MRPYRNFVIKNISGKSVNAGMLQDGTVDRLCDRLREYVEAYNEPNEEKRNEKLSAFFDPSNWPETENKTGKAQESFNKSLIKAAQDNKCSIDVAKAKFGSTIKAKWLFDRSKTYKHFANILMYATFRQTSKLGLDFFKSQNKPILFHMSNRDLTDFGDTKDWILKDNHWKTGQMDEKYGGSEITHSEVRHANKIVKQYGDANANLWYVHGA